MKKIGEYIGEISRYKITKEEWSKKYKNEPGVSLVSDNGDTVVIDILEYLMKK